MEKEQRHVFRVVECSLVIKFSVVVVWLVGWVFLFFLQGLGGTWHALGDLCYPPRVKPVPPKLEGQSLKIKLFYFTKLPTLCLGLSICFNLPDFLLWLWLSVQFIHNLLTA